MKQRLIDRIKVGKMVYRTKYKEINSKIIGYDTETYKGKVTLISNSDKEYLIYNNVFELLEFLTNKKVSTLNFFFNLEYDSNAIIKCFPDENIREIGFFNKTTLKNDSNEYNIFNIKRKVLVIEKHDKKYKFYDISQFYQLGSLEKTHNRIFPEKNFKKSMDASKEFPIENITQEDIDYCINDSIACMELAEHFVNTTRKLIPVKCFYSPASLGKTLLRMNLEGYYKFNPNETQKIALLGYNGGRFETMKIGKCNVYQYDINSAYPYALKNIPDLTGYHIKNMEYEPNAIHSFYNCDFTIHDDFNICPIRYEHKNLLLYPNGKFINYVLTKTEYELLKKLGIRIKINYAHHILNDTPNYPFKFLQEIYDLRKKYKKENNPLQLPLKLAMNSIYGIMIQTTKDYEIIDEYEDSETMDYDNIVISKCRKCKMEYKEDTLPRDGICVCGNDSFDEKLLIPNFKAGNFFNPVIASEITANIRCKLFEDSLKYEDNIFMYATDSITTDKKLNLPISDKLGDYSVGEKLEGVIFGSGIYSLHNENEHKVRFRGFTQKDTLVIAKNNLKDNVYIEKFKRPIKLKEALIQKELGIENMNVFKEFAKDFRLNFDVKRQWDRKALNFKDLLDNQIDSKPKNIQDHLTKINIS